MKSLFLFLLVTLVSSALSAFASTTAETVRAAIDLSRQTFHASKRFAFTGQVIEVDSRSFIIQDGTGCICIRNETDPKVFPSRGDFIRTTGRCGQSHQYTLRLYAEHIVRTGNGPMPAPEEISASQLHDNELLHRFVTMRGVLASVDYDEIDRQTIWLKIRTPNMSFFAYTSTNFYSVAKLQGLIDAEIKLYGFVYDAPVWRLSPSTQYLRTNPNNPISVLTPAPKDPFSSPRLSLANAPHRQCAIGFVVAAGSSGYFLRTGKHDYDLHFVKPKRGQRPPAARNTVLISGFTEVDRGRLLFRDAVARQTSVQSRISEKPSVLPFPEIFAAGSARSHGKSILGLHGKLITTQAHVNSIVSSDRKPQGLLLEENGCQMFVDLSCLPCRPPKDFASGCLLGVTGYCNIEFDGLMSGQDAPHFNRLILLPRTPDDVKIIAHPPWWTPARLFFVVLLLAAIIVAISIWNILLTRLSERRGKELYTERIDHALAEQKVEERTRLAVELHDSVSQTLTGVALQLDGGEVETAKTMLASCRGELRRCLWDLRSRTFEEKDMTEAVTRTITPHLNGVEATVRFNVPRERLSESLTHAILRIIRELVVNAIRHGQAKQIRIAGEMHANIVSFSVTDNGRGSQSSCTTPSRRR